jgi:nucleoside-diphosphate-sugar epimerase
MLINGVEELEDRLSEPTAADVAAMSALGGDILILGAAGKMGPSLAKLMHRSIRAAGVKRRVIAAARFSTPEVRCDLEKAGIQTLTFDLLRPGVLTELPDIENVIFMAARKFGTSGSEHLTWAMNTFLPGLVAERYRSSRIVAFSTGNVYGLQPVSGGGATETTPVAPEGEYAQSALGRERMFEYGSSQWGTQVVLLRLNYAVEMRYGVLVDIASAVFDRRAIDLQMGYVNVIWQRDANSACLRSLAQCQSPPLVLNITGPEILSVRHIAEEFGKRFRIKPIFSGRESDVAILSSAVKARELFGPPSISADQLIEWTAQWITKGGPLLNKPTHYEVQDGKF